MCQSPFFGDWHGYFCTVKNKNIKYMEGFTGNGKKRLSAFALMLEDYLMQQHPDKMDDAGFIETRSKEAEEAFYEASRQGAEVGQSIEKAMDVLYRGLRFSPYRTIREIICDLLPETDEVEKHRLVMQMMEYNGKELAEYDTSDDGFAGTEECAYLTDRLRAGIAGYLYDNALDT